MDDAKRAAAADFLDYVRGGEAQRQFQQFAFRGHDGRAGPTVDRADGLDPKEPASRLALPSAEVLDKVVASWATLRKRANALVVDDGISLENLLPRLRTELEDRPGSTRPSPWSSPTSSCRPPWRATRRAISRLRAGGGGIRCRQGLT